MDYIITQSGDFVRADELYHHGIKGMKWGVRRYQNKDGSLTPAGKTRVKERTGKKDDPFGLEKHDLSVDDRNKFYATKRPLANKQVEEDYSDSDIKKHRDWLGKLNAAYDKWYNLDKEPRSDKEQKKWRDEYEKLMDDPVAKREDTCRDRFIYEQGSSRLKTAMDTAKTKGYNLDWTLSRTDTTYEHGELYMAYMDALTAKVYDSDEVRHSNVGLGELYHWGIKGMKWGQRRYQNKDGSLTPAGKKRYNDSVNALKEREKVIKNREREKARQAKLDAKKADLDAREKALDGDAKAGKKSRKDKKAEAAETPKKKSISEMTDEELNQAIQRARMEDAYRQLRPEPVAPPKMSERLMKEVVTPALMNSGKKALESMMDAAVKNALKDKVDPNSLAGLEAANKKLRAQIENTLLKQGIDPNIKGENLDKWKKFNESLKPNQRNDKTGSDKNGSAPKNEDSASDAKAGTKADTKADTATDTNTTPSVEKGRRQQQNWDAMNRAGANSTRRPDRVDQDNFDFDYEPPKAKVTVEGKGTSHKQSTSDRKRPDPIIIDADEYPASSSGLPAIYNRNTAVTDIAPRYTDAGRTYVETLLLPAPKDRDD